MTVPLFEPPHRRMPRHPAISAYRGALPEGEVVAYPLDRLDRLGLPVWSAELFAARGTMHHGVGFGETDERAAIGAFGELSEALFAGDAVGRLRPRLARGHPARRRGQGRQGAGGRRLRAPLRQPRRPADSVAAVLAGLPHHPVYSHV